MEEPLTVQHIHPTNNLKCDVRPSLHCDLSSNVVSLHDTYIIRTRMLDSVHRSSTKLEKHIPARASPACKTHRACSQAVGVARICTSRRHSGHFLRAVQKKNAKEKALMSLCQGFLRLVSITTLDWKRWPVVRGSPATASVVFLPVDCGRKGACGQEALRTFVEKQAQQ